MQFDGHATIGIFGTRRIPIAHQRDTVAVFQFVVAVGARNIPRQYLSQLSLCHAPNINGGCDIVVDTARVRRLSHRDKPRIVGDPLLTIGKDPSPW